MKIDGEKTVKLSSEQAYGEYDDTKIQTVPKDKLQTFIDA
jgi:FKBP-type peptidyl-prolyl cis-trans isomerase 2